LKSSCHRKIRLKFEFRNSNFVNGLERRNYQNRSYRS
jgi:hypothetical protein